MRKNPAQTNIIIKSFGIFVHETEIVRKERRIFMLMTMSCHLLLKIWWHSDDCSDGISTLGRKQNIRLFILFPSSHGRQRSFSSQTSLCALFSLVSSNTFLCLVYFSPFHPSFITLYPCYDKGLLALSSVLPMNDPAFILSFGVSVKHVVALELAPIEMPLWGHKYSFI